MSRENVYMATFMDASSTVFFCQNLVESWLELEVEDTVVDVKFHSLSSPNQET